MKVGMGFAPNPMRWRVQLNPCAAWHLRREEWTWQVSNVDTERTYPIANVIAAASGVDVGVVRLFRRRARLEVPGVLQPYDVEAVGIGGVFVAPEHRGQGIASALLMAALGVVMGGGELWQRVEVALLHATDQRLYHAHGFAGVVGDLLALPLGIHGAALLATYRANHPRFPGDPTPAATLSLYPEYKF